ncbi:leucine-rich repeat domain-containing protein [Mycoplasma sp. Z631]|uniref:leucine-rich repeat domain-containing protein n=1 Tax=Mycoplasma sp. Z631 TaxID=3401685 RepID=UPI003AADB7F7
MTKIAKYIIIVTSGLVVGSAVIAIPSVIYKKHKNYKDQQAKLKEIEKQITVSLNNSINKAEKYASQITVNDILFKNYDNSLFTISLVEITTPLNHELNIVDNTDTKVQYFTTNDNNGTLHFKYRIQSKKYSDLYTIKSCMLDGFKTLKTDVIIKPINPEIKKPISENNVVEFDYNSGENKAKVKFNADDSKLVIKDIETVTEKDLGSILNLVAEKNSQYIHKPIILDCPDAKVFPLYNPTYYRIAKINLPKLEKVTYVEEPGIMSPGALIWGLQDDKVVQNGILFKWENASGDIYDESITQIMPGAFGDTSKITSINLPNLKNISSHAFRSASSIEKLFPLIKSKVVLNDILIKWPEAVGDIKDNHITKIYNYAFENNQNITSVSFPNVTSIGDAAFHGSKNLTSINFPKVESLGSEVFGNTEKLDNKIVLNNILAKWENATGDLYDDKITKIASGVFMGQNDITSVSFPNVTDIGLAAFAGMRNLSTVHLPKTINIGELAFALNTELKIIDFPSAKTIGRSAFMDDINLEVVSFPNVISIGIEAFKNAEKLKSINFSNAVYIGGASFQNASSLVSVTFPKAEIIENNAFSEARNLASAIFPKVTEIRDYAFSDNISLNKAEFPAIKNVGNNIFGNTPKLLGKIVLGNTLVKWSDASGNISDENITKIAANAFKDNSNITSVSFPNVTSIGEEAFAGTTNLVSVALPNVTNVGNRAFYKATNLASVELPKATNIGDQAFSGTIKLTTIDLPQATNIETAAFYDASSLVDIKLPKIQYIPASAFKGTSNLTTLFAPNVTYIGSDAFKDATSLTSAIFPKVIQIEDSAFNGATNLAEISFPKIEKLSGGDIFKNTPKLPDKIVLNGFLAKWDNASGDITDDTISIITDKVFINNDNITSISFPNVISVGYSAFQGSKKIASINLPNVINIKDWAFQGLENLTTISLPKVEKIGRSSFKENTNLVSISAPKVIEIGPEAFAFDSALETLNFPELLKINQGTFMNAKGLKLIFAPKVNEINSSAFVNAESLVSASFPNVTFIGEYAFENNKNLKSASFPEVLEIKSYAFGNDINLTSVYAPKVKILSPTSFDYTPKLKNIPIINP